MIIVDTALKARHAEGRPIRLGILGAGCVGRGLTNQLVNTIKGITIAGLYNRTVSRAHDAYRYAGVEAVTEVGTQGAFDAALEAGKNVVTGDPMLLARSPHVDVLIDAIGDVELGARVALEAFKHGKDVILMNAELDATVGPILQVYADKYGVIASACDGDEPAVQMNLHRWVVGMGLTPRVLGNVKGLKDCYRNPTTQKGFAEKWGQSPEICTSAADGSKVSFEQAIVANATGFGVQSRGMSRGKEYRGDVLSLGQIYDVDDSDARSDWGFAPAYDLGRAFNDYLLPNIRRRYAK